jgi:hypothetical protein
MNPRAFADIASTVPDLFDLSSIESVVQCRDYVIAQLDQVTGKRHGAKIQMKGPGARDTSLDPYFVRCHDRVRIVFFELSDRGRAQGNLRHG